MADFSAGDQCTVKSYRQDEKTLVNQSDPCNGTGVIDHLCIDWEVHIGGTVDARVASFIHEGSNVLTARDSASLPNGGEDITEYNAPGDFTAFDINEGDYIGGYGTSGDSYGSVGYKQTVGHCFWYVVGDQTECQSYTFDVFPTGYGTSIYATGTEVSGESGDEIKFLKSILNSILCKVLN